MTPLSPSGFNPLPVPPNYLRTAEQNQVREMTRPMGRPPGDQRSAEQIIEQSPVMQRFMEGRDHYQVGDDLKKQVGDWTDANHDPQSRADAAYDLDKVLRFIDNVDDQTLNASYSRNGHIDGFNEDGFGSVDNSEARRLQQFSRYGYETLRYLPT